jgi:hypothetical protein
MSASPVRPPTRMRRARCASPRYPVPMLGALVALLMTLVAIVARADDGLDALEGSVRTGTTELTSPRVVPPREAPGAASGSSEHAPGDAPKFSSELPTVPKAPVSFNSYDGGWIRFAYPPSVRERVQPLIAISDEVRVELASRLGRPVLDRVHVYVARTPGEMATLAPEGAPFPKYAAGVAYSELGLVLLTIAPVEPAAQHDLTEIFRHELAHVALHEAVSGYHVPRWFNEGFAVYASGEGSFARLQTLWTATLADDLLTLEQLDRTFPANALDASVAYAQAADLLRFLLRQQDRHRFTALIDRLTRGQSFDEALTNSYGTDLATLEYEWREEVAKRYTFWPVFFSGTMIWALALGLFVWGYRRRRRKSRETLARWAREEAAEDERRKMREREEQARVHIVLSRSERTRDLRPPLARDSGVPKVEHDGQWHTLH